MHAKQHFFALNASSIVFFASESGVFSLIYAKKNIPHGVANALLLPTIMEFNAPVCREKYIDALLVSAASQPCFQQ